MNGRATEPNAAVLVLGTEILHGDIRDTNSDWLARQLYDLGVRNDLIMTLPDSEEVVLECFEPLMPRYDFILTSGGLGPTPDDQTRQIIAELTGRELELNEAARSELEEYYGDDLTEVRLSMAHLPEGAEPISADRPGIPGFKVDGFYSFPGVPALMQQMFERVREEFRTAPYHRRELKTGIGESSFTHLLHDAEEHFPGLTIGSYPRFGERWKAHIIIRGKDEENVAACRDFLERELDDLAESRGVSGNR